MIIQFRRYFFDFSLPLYSVWGAKTTKQFQNTRKHKKGEVPINIFYSDLSDYGVEFYEDNDKNKKNEIKQFVLPWNFSLEPLLLLPRNRPF